MDGSGVEVVADAGGLGLEGAVIVVMGDALVVDFGCWGLGLEDDWFIFGAIEELCFLWDLLRGYLRLHNSRHSNRHS